MRIYQRGHEPLVAFSKEDHGSDPPWSFFLASTPIDFGSPVSWYNRWRRRAEDQNFMCRGLLMSRPGDRVYIQTPTKNIALALDNARVAAGIYAAAGIEVGDVVPFSGSLQKALRDAARRQPIVLTIYDPTASQILGDRRLLRAVKILNDRVRASQYLASQGVGLPQSSAVWVDPLMINLRGAIRHHGLPCYVKRRCSAGGVGNQKVQSITQQVPQLARLVGQRVQVQEYLPQEESNGVVYRITRERAKRLFLSRQRIACAKYYVGSDWCDVVPGLDAADDAAEACRRLGYVGLLGLDLKGMICDVNPRFTASALLSAVFSRVERVSRLSLSCYHSQPADGLQECGLDRLWYCDGRGVLPVEWSSRHGWISLVIINDHDGEVEAEVVRRLGGHRKNGIFF